MKSKFFIFIVSIYFVSMAKAYNVKLTPNMYKYSQYSITGVYLCTPSHVASGDCSDVDKEYYDNLARITLGAYEVGILSVNNEKTIAFKGPLSPGSADVLIGILKNNPSIKTLALSSQGGSEEESYKIADYVKSHGLNTWVPVRRMCLSACVAIFLSGNEKILDGQLGMHTGQFFINDPYQIRNLEAARATFQQAMYENDKFMMRRVRMFIELGIDLSILESMIEAKGDFLVFTSMSEIFNVSKDKNYVWPLAQMSKYAKEQPVNNFDFQGYQQLY